MRSLARDVQPAVGHVDPDNAAAACVGAEGAVQRENGRVLRFIEEDSLERERDVTQVEPHRWDDDTRFALATAEAQYGTPLGGPPPGVGLGCHPRRAEGLLGAR